MPSYGKAYNVGRFGIVVEWLRREGEQFEAGEPLVIVESDKVTLEVRAPEDGTLVQILAPVGTRLTAYEKLALFEARVEQLSSGRDVQEPASTVAKDGASEASGD